MPKDWNDWEDVDQARLDREVIIVYPHDGKGPVEVMWEDGFWTEQSKYSYGFAWTESALKGSKWIFPPGRQRTR